MLKSVSPVALFAAAAFAAAPGSAAAHEHEAAYPHLTATIPIELEYDNTFDSSIPGGEVSDLYFTIEPELVLEFTPWLAVTAGLVFEPVEDLDPDEDRAFEDHGLYVETLVAELSFDPVVVHIGKFTPRFGFAVDNVPGLLGDTFAEDVEVTERVGFGATYAFGGGTMGSFELQGSVFYRDTSLLSESFFTDRGDLDKSDGGVGNTEDLSNFAVSLDAFDLFGAEGLSGRVAYLSQEGGVGDLSDQDAWLIALAYDIPLNEDMSLYPIIEWASSEDAQGFGDAISIPGGGQDVLTVGVGFFTGPWNAAIVYGDRDNEDPIGGDLDEEFWQLSGGYLFDCGLGLDVAFGGYEDNAGTEDDFFSILLSYEFEFGNEDEE
jgi:hypothetical protein